MGPKKAKLGTRPASAPTSKPPTAQAAPAVPAKKKKKNDPLRPQPAWLFPPDEENPILNPRNKSKEEIQKEIDERLAAIKFLEHKSVTAPVKTAPPPELLQLVGSFLASYGFVSTGRIFSLERNARKKLDGWNDHIGEKRFAKNQPDLVKIFKDWRADWEGESDEDTSSSGEDSEQDVPMKNIKSDSDDSEDESSEDEEEAEAAKPKSKANGTTIRTTLRNPIEKAAPSKKSSTSSSSSSESESEDDSKEKATGIALATKAPSRKLEKPSQATSDSESSSESSSESDSESEQEADPVKTSLQTPISVANEISNPPAVPQTAGSDSSETLKADSPKKELSPSVSSSNTTSSASSSDSDSDSTSSSESSGPGQSTTKSQSKSSKKRKASSPEDEDEDVSANLSNKKAKTTKESFSRIPKDIQIDPRLASNKYVSYDYADKAHRDLVVTKGKGFTKEKNKKKRGAYRGGRIDTDGGKGVKFDN